MSIGTKSGGGYVGVVAEVCAHRCYGCGGIKSRLYVLRHTCATGLGASALRGGRGGKALVETQRGGGFECANSVDCGGGRVGEVC